ncbi:MAG: hypothetical protein ABL874_03230 [Sphingopyxis sp.]
MNDTPPFDMDEYRRRQAARTRIMGLGLIALAVLIFFVTIAKIGLAQP